MNVVRKSDRGGYRKDPEVRRRAHYVELCEIAEGRGGRVISDSYVNSKIKMLFEDASGFQFWMVPYAVKRGQWSPREALQLGEHVSRQSVKHVFKGKFPPRKDVISRDNGNWLELDGYCEELATAFE
jgi:hypothetical protein